MYIWSKESKNNSLSNTWMDSRKTETTGRRRKNDTNWRPTAPTLHKFINEARLQAVLRTTQGQLDYIHETGELSVLYIERGGVGERRPKVANLPPEVQDRKLRDAISQYGDVRTIIEKLWSRGYRYPVSNGIRIVEMDLKKHIPSNMSIVGNRVLISYEGQPVTCYGCNEPGHQYHECPNRRTMHLP